MADRVRPNRWRVRREPLGFRSPTTGTAQPWLVYAPRQGFADWWAPTQAEAFRIAQAFAHARAVADEVMSRG